MFNLVNMSRDYDKMRDRIFELLAERRLSQKNLAEMLDVSPQTITDWKNGKSNSFCKMGEKIAQVLETTPSWLCYGIGRKYMSTEQLTAIINQERKYLEASERNIKHPTPETERDARSEWEKMIRLKYDGLSDEEILSRISFFNDPFGAKQRDTEKQTSNIWDELTDSEQEMVLAYRAADDRARQVVDLTLEPWKKNEFSGEAM